jgi:nitrate/nitrite transporter NarK
VIATEPLAERVGIYPSIVAISVMAVTPLAAAAVSGTPIFTAVTPVTLMGSAGRVIGVIGMTGALTAFVLAPVALMLLCECWHRSNKKKQSGQTDKLFHVTSQG